MEFYTVEDRVLDAYRLHKRRDIGIENYDIPKSILNKKISVYICNARKHTTDESNPCLRAYYFGNMIIHVDELKRKVFYIRFSNDKGINYGVNSSKVRRELGLLGINRKGNGYKKSYLVCNDKI